MFADVLRNLRKAKGLSQEELASIIGVSKSTIGMYEQGKRIPKADATLKKIADYFNVSIDSLMGFSILKENKRVISKDNNIGTPYNPKIHKIPILGFISAGLPLYADDHIEGYTYTELNGGAEYFALRVKGDSMSAAQINDGNIIIVRKQDIVENGEIAVVRVGSDDATVKRFRQDGEVVQLIPQSFNPEHNIQFYNLKDTNIDVIGKVVECKVEF